MALEYVGHGSFGCVTRPALPCRRENRKGASSSFRVGGPTVSKIFGNSADAKHESDGMCTVQRLDPDSAFTLQPLLRCEAPRAAIPARVAQRCAIDAAWSNNEFVHHIVYPDGGTSLANLPPSVTARELCRAMPTLLRGLRTLLKHGVCHQDIKPHNIVYNVATKRLALIDFGLAVNMADVYTMDNAARLDHHYPWYPPEFTLAALVASSDARTLRRYRRDPAPLVRRCLRNPLWLRERVEGHLPEGGRRLPPAARKVLNALTDSTAQASLEAYARHVLGDDTRDRKTILARFRADAVDTYGLAAACFEVLTALPGAYRVDAATWQYLGTMLHTDPRERLKKKKT